MPNISTFVDEETYKRLAEKRRAAGLVSISALFLQSCGELDDRSEAQSIAHTAFSRAATKQAGDEFTLSKLFQRGEWKGFGKIARLQSGRIFKAEIDAGKHPIVPVRISPGNHQVYLRLPSASLSHE